MASPGLDTYDVDDPFRSPSPDRRAKPKHKDAAAVAAGLGLDEEVSVAKRARVPRVKLDEHRLMSEKGIPTLRKRSARLRFKGKGHEFNDTARLLTFYQLWLDDLFPKARFLDALEMVEKTGHKKVMKTARVAWIDEAKQQQQHQKERLRGDTFAPTTLEPLVQNTPPPTTATATAETAGTFARGAGDEEEQQQQQQSLVTTGGASGGAGGHGDDYDDDELDALMAEAENHNSSSSSAKAHPPPTDGGREGHNEFEDEEALMAEMDGLW